MDNDWSEYCVKCEHYQCMQQCRVGEYCPLYSEDGCICHWPPEAWCPHFKEVSEDG